MAITAFPPLEEADENGLLCVGGDLEVESLLLAYRSGIFPWPFGEEYFVTWFSPPKRGLLYLDKFHVAASLRKELKRGKFRFEIDSNFEAVIRACAKRNKPTWITKAMIDGYLNLHQAGYCHSIECYQGTKLAGGLYGVSIGGMFAGESMFHRVNNASKAALCFLVEYLREREVKWIDCQQLTPLLKSFGAVEVERGEFVKMLRRAVREDVRLF